MYIVNLADKAAQDINLCGGKAVNLSILINSSKLNIPDGFVVTTELYKKICVDLISPLVLELTDSENISDLCLEIREKIKQKVFDENSEELNLIRNELSRFPAETKFAVRSSATAEDLPDASFAGQQDSYLNISAEDVPDAIIKCFSSLYNDRAFFYRKENNFDENNLSLAVVVQEMVDSEISGVMFTADPLTSDRYTCVIESVAGLGEELVSGHKTPFTYKIRNKKISFESKGKNLLKKENIIELHKIGKKIEEIFHAPQDIEYCFAKNKFYIVQSRPITALFPPPYSPDGFKRLFVSAGHLQMMTDAICPLGVSFMKFIALFKMVESGGHLYIDITHDLKTVYGKKMIKTKLGTMDSLTFSAINEILSRKEYIASVPKGPGSFSSFNNWGPMLTEAVRIYRKNDQSEIDKYIEKMRNKIRLLDKRFENAESSEVLDIIKDDQQKLLDAVYDSTGFGMVLATQYAIQRIDSICKKLTGEDNYSNKLSKSVKYNITSEMGLALSELSDVLRDYPDVIDFFENQKFSMDELRKINGGEIVADCFSEFLEKFGMRATGEIDICKTRFRENPAELIPVILSNIRTLPKGYGKASFDEGFKESKKRIREILNLASEKMGKAKAKQLKKYISIFRNFVGTREYPKYFWICHYDIYKKYLMKEAKRLENEGILKSADDIYYLYFDELRELFETRIPDYDLIEKRRKDYISYRKLTPPRLIFSDGEVPVMNYNKDIPSNALAGLAVSAGIAEGRARIINSIEEANIEKGDILITSFTDPSWTPVFVSISALVTEIGGMMTHGAVITREYGLPAVVGVLNATKLIKDGQKIRVNGDKGYIEILE